MCPRKYYLSIVCMVYQYLTGEGEKKLNEWERGLLIEKINSGGSCLIEEDSHLVLLFSGYIRVQPYWNKQFKRKLVNYCYVFLNYNRF